MRKLTGYIGAMIIVIALMGSILAGYALNINGTSAVMNDYEKVTDVSGLYTHSQEPSYIEYNPASNYIGYSVDNSYTNDGTAMYKKIVNGQVRISSNSLNVRIDEVSQGAPPFPNYSFICDKFYIYNESQTTSTLYMNYGGTWYRTTVDYTVITINLPNVTINFNQGNETTFNDITLALAYCSDGTADYCCTLNKPKTVYLNNENQVILSINDPSGYGIAVGNKAYILPTNTTTTAYTFNSKTGDINTGVYSYLIGQTPVLVWGVFYPKVVNSVSTGINYTESNRVNNYLINTEPANTIKTSTKMDLMSISAADQWDTPENILAATIIANHSTPPYPTWSFFTPNYTNQYGGGEAAVKNDIVIYKLSDVLSTYTIPSGTQTVKIDFNSTDTRPYTFYGNTWYLDGNVAFFQKLTEPYNYYENKNIANEKLYGVYDPYTNLVSVYQPNGILEYTETPDNIGVLFVKPNQIYGRFQYHESVNGNYYTEPYTMANRQNPFVTMTSSVYNPANNHYMDITKGISIKSTNVADTNWNNEYSNGKIQILFRAETTPGTYHNTLTIGDNVISVDYNTNKYLVTLNGNDPVDIGTWRNIVLNVDLINGELSAIPVRTFNSYTNVELDNTNIFIGNLVNAAPINIIKWAPTTDSLTFNVYSTSVFMNTYGVVMVDPTLNITDYFTTLDNFYQLRLSNFSMYGQSMTINGVTGTVTGNTISFNDETIQIKDMAITYADGHAYISDSHATIDLGEITDNNISMSGAWYFITDLMRGYTTEKMIYEWDWQDFILDNVQFCIIYIGLALIGLLIARRYCTLTITDYALFLVSIVIALTVQVIA